MWYENCVMRLNHSIRFESICFGVLNNFPLCRDCVCELSREQTTDARRKGRFQSVAKRRMCCVCGKRVYYTDAGYSISCDTFEESERARARLQISPIWPGWNSSIYAPKRRLEWKFHHALLPSSCLMSGKCVSIFSRRPVCWRNRFEVGYLISRSGHNKALR